MSKGNGSNLNCQEEEEVQSQVRMHVFETIPSRGIRSQDPTGNHTPVSRGSHSRAPMGSRAHTLGGDRGHRTHSANVSGHANANHQQTEPGSDRGSRAPTLGNTDRQMRSGEDGSIHRGMTRLIEQAVAQAVALAMQNPGVVAGNDAPATMVQQNNNAYHQTLRVINSSKPDDFDGKGAPDQVMQWLTHMDKLFHGLSCSDQDKVHITALRLKGLAGEWWETVRAD